MAEQTLEEKVAAACGKAKVEPKVRAKDVLGCRQEGQGGPIFAVTAHGHELQIGGGDVEILRGPGYEPPAEVSAEIEEVLAGLSDKQKAELVDRIIAGAK